ncbi:hypothetical protein C0V72_11915 [Porphyrobacter sp. TH134]|uniref:winged helix-turn-helix domain-containing protein n=1 Tax=Porphyrobacter sp. TH134 TaxID=2067450 RepID=UPI000C79C71E|nr:winged helix-turn-helix domain-containing protein [Porphyrobacter sp. TH134]PLK23036.1 hypothetical protein C0V72_11915 [Porphyrobacter sp. TH134]
MNAVLHPDHFSACDVTGPRFREAGDVTLDLFHRDGRVDDRWLGLHPREFALLWRLAQQPGALLTEAQLLAEAWGLPSDTICQSVAACVLRIGVKLDAVGLASLIGTHAEGGYVLVVPAPTDLSGGAGAAGAG